MGNVQEKPINVAIPVPLLTELDVFLADEGSNRKKKTVVAAAIFMVTRLTDEQLAQVIRQMKATLSGQQPTNGRVSVVLHVGEAQSKPPTSRNTRKSA